uniref:Thiopurine S-methyltransferase n=1 Tax=Polytomella parva TaxID=51329 RepID=A0A6U0VE35_9CHLO|mmetsp:Transcript_21599/g.38560  ORF Transcript_21599/g.38560 Transcript_21599/m.38560 type:complete len:280 (+) Transcript_21599:30-869(+)
MELKSEKEKKNMHNCLITRKYQAPSTLKVHFSKKNYTLRRSFVAMSSTAEEGSKTAQCKQLWNEYDNKWHNYWTNGVAPGVFWDKCESPPSLRNYVTENIESIKGKRVLVPGCGRGYDVATFAAAGAGRSLGLDLSTVAVETANAYVSETLTKANMPNGGEGVALVKEANFFTFEDPEGPFDIGFDYTFFCAMHPSMRHEWATSWARVLRPGSKLLALEYPMDPSADVNAGPPFPVTPALYRQYLEPVGFECVSETPLKEGESHPTREGKELFAVYVRK